MNLTIGITTYNRLIYIKRMAESLNSSNEIHKYNIRIYDDNSNEFEQGLLEQLFPLNKQIIRRRKNLGADFNMYKMFMDFLLTQDEALFIADSDLIFNPDWLLKIEILFSHTDGILSLYNSVNHKTTSNVLINGHSFLLKEHIGAAGTILRRDLVELIITCVPLSYSFDWDWSNYLINQGLKLMVVEESLVQHIGVTGENNNGRWGIDFGLNFYPGSISNERILIHFFQESIISQNRFIRRNLWLHLYFYKIIYLLKWLKRTLKIKRASIVSISQI